MNPDILGIHGLKEILRDIGEACSKLEIEFFIAGSVATNIHYAEGHLRPSLTKDVDFVVHVPHETQYYELKDILIIEYGYSPDPSNEFRVIRPDGNAIDLLPFGSLEIDDSIDRKTIGFVNLTPNGLQEIFSSGLNQIKLAGYDYKVCGISAIIIMKIIAFDDRPGKRQKDIRDINSIIMHYEQIEDDLVWSEYDYIFDTLPDDEISPYVLGSEMRKITSENPNLHRRIEDILRQAIHQTNPIAELMIVNAQTDTIEDKTTLIKNVLRGFTG